MKYSNLPLDTQLFLQLEHDNSNFAIEEIRRSEMSSKLKTKLIEGIRDRMKKIVITILETHDEEWKRMKDEKKQLDLNKK